jgi:hypothetical protein
MIKPPRIAHSRIPSSFPRPRIGYWGRLLATGLTLGLAAFVQTARADVVILDDHFNDPGNRLTVNTNGIGGGFGSFTQSTGYTRETNSLGVIGNTGNGAGRANIASQNPMDISAVGTLFDFQNVSYTNTVVGGAPNTDRLIIGVIATNVASDWFESSQAGLPGGFYIEPNSQSIALGGASALANSYWTNHTSCFFYKDPKSGTVTILTNWQFKTLAWNGGSGGGPGGYGTNYSPVLDVQLTLSATGWRLYITGDVNTNNQPIDFSATYAASGIDNVFLDGINNGYIGTEVQSEGPCIQQTIDRIVVTHLGNLVVTTPNFSTPEYGGNVNTVRAGEAVALSSLVVDSAGTPALQWQLENLASPGTFTNLPGGTATNVNVDTGGLGDSLPRGIRLLANDGLNSVTSAVVKLTVNPASAPVVTQDPTPSILNLYPGQGGTFAARFTGNLPITYNWQHSTDGGSYTNIPGATNYNYIVQSASDSDAGFYQLYASNSVGEAYSAAPGYVQILTGTPKIIWSAALPFTFLSAEQILTNFPSTNKIAGALVGQGTAITVTLTNAGNQQIVFAPRGATAWANVTGGAGQTTGANTNRTGNTPFNNCLNAKYYDGGTHMVVMSNLIVGQKYQVQLFALDDGAAYLTRAITWQDPADVNDVSATYMMGDNAYMLGTFTAANTVETIQQNLLSAGAANFNCMVLRTVGWTPAPYWVSQPTSPGAFAGTRVTLSGSAAGDTTIPSPAISYQWQAGPAGGPYTNLVDGTKYAGTTVGSLTISNLTADDGIPAYVLIAANGGGSTTSSVAKVLIQTAPAAPPAGSFGAYALSNAPVAYWQLDETLNPSIGSVLVYDYSGNGRIGTYGVGSQNAYNTVLSPQPPTYPGFALNQGALRPTAGQLNSAVTIPGLNLNTNAVTICMWINPSGNPGTFTGLLFERGGSETDGFGFGGTTSGGMPALGYTWNNNSATTYNYNSGLYPQQNLWQFVALVVKSNSATFYLYYLDPVSGQPQFRTAVQNNTQNNQAFNGAGGGTILLGGDSSAANRTFPGSISDAAVYNAALTQQQILQLFGAGLGVQGFPPVIGTQPVDVAAYDGVTVQFKVGNVGGTQPITNQWQLNGVNLTNSAHLSGVTSNTLTIFGVSPADVGSYHVSLTNTVGSTVSSNATLSIVTTPPVALVGQWLSGGQSLSDVSGYSAGGLHDGMLWATNGSVAWTNDVPASAPNGSYALAFSNAAIIISNSSTLDAAYVNTYDGVIASNLTVMCWAKGFPGQWNAWVSKYGDSGLNPVSGWQLRTYSSGPNSAWTLRGTGAGDDMQSAIGSNDGLWHHYAGTYDAYSGVRSLYVDGVLAAQESATNGQFNGGYTLAGPEHVLIGGRDQPPGANYTGYFTGKIYDVRIYGTALSQSQIGQMVPGLKPTMFKPQTVTGATGSSLVLSWSFGTLLEATNAAGPWNTTTNTSPFTNSATLPADFFKVSNP